jgi:D-alanyl-lipoteichoic acid acyltransferase DltB (MBOAT superfamily)
VASSVICNLGLLAVFKYFNFFSANIAALFETWHWHVSLPLLRLALPAGISFYTFQSIGYVVDVYRGHVPACRSLRDYTVFVAFFPQLVAGPIQRAGDLLGQIQRPRTLSADTAYQALFLLLWGFFKKLVIADNVAIIANKTFSIQAPSFPVLWVGVLAFAVQIYADFSAYTDIARASARFLGFELSPNFNHPYLANSPSDFWRRWHISLSTWIRDYLYIPLGGSKVSRPLEIRNLFIVFFLTGLWHGASWNFVIWGIYYAVLTVIYRIAEKFAPADWKPSVAVNAARILLMFILTNIGWLIFREHNMGMLWRDLTLSPLGTPQAEWLVGKYLFVLVLLYSLPLVLHMVWDLSLRGLWQRTGAGSARIPISVANIGVATLMFLTILVLRSDTAQDFIYFQF